MQLARLVLAVAGLVGVAAIPVEAAPRAFVCEFADGQSWTYGLTGFSAGQPVKLAFTIQNVDEAKETAVLVSQTGGVPLKLVRALDAQHFIEVTVAGFLNITTIYERESGQEDWPAVHSRHLGIIGQPLVSQFRGSCRPTGQS
ncbi:MAG: hypothetical protein GC150_15560 [Rhizobiales bacterium]|nr:hypothetical protein [Hyphomicrobiales bacterium]